jgi:hypothetical protein
VSSSVGVSSQLSADVGRTFPLLSDVELSYPAWLMGWPHDPGDRVAHDGGETAGTWPHEAGDWHAPPLSFCIKLAYGSWSGCPPKPRDISCRRPSPYAIGRLQPIGPKRIGRARLSSLPPFLCWPGLLACSGGARRFTGVRRSKAAPWVAALRVARSPPEGYRVEQLSLVIGAPEIGAKPSSRGLGTQ